MKLLLTLAIAIALAGATAAASSNSASISIPYPATLSGTPVEAGKYTLTWEEHSQEVTVNLVRNKEVAATSRGRMEQRSLEYNRNQVLYQTDSSGKQAISEIRLGGTNRAIVFER